MLFTCANAFYSLPFFENLGVFLLFQIPVMVFIPCSPASSSHTYSNRNHHTWRSVEITVIIAIAAVLLYRKRKHT